MLRWFIAISFWITAAIILCLALGCAGIAQMSDDWCAAHPQAGPSRCTRNPLHQYDAQGHIEGHPAGCPTAVYTAPNGELTQC